MMEMVLVEWVDARGVGTDWKPVSEMREGLCSAHSLGFLVHETDDYVVILPHLLDEGANPDQGVGEMNIPKKAVKRLVVLKETE